MAGADAGKTLTPISHPRPASSLNMRSWMTRRLSSALSGTSLTRVPSIVSRASAYTSPRLFSKMTDSPRSWDRMRDSSIHASPHVDPGHLTLFRMSVQDTLEQSYVILLQVASRSKPRHALSCILQALETIRTYRNPPPYVNDRVDWCSRASPGHAPPPLASRSCQSRTFAYSRKLTRSASPLLVKVGRKTCRENTARLVSFDTMENLETLGSVRSTSLKD